MQGKKYNSKLYPRSTRSVEKWPISLILYIVICTTVTLTIYAISVYVAFFCCSWLTELVHLLYIQTATHVCIHVLDFSQIFAIFVQYWIIWPPWASNSYSIETIWEIQEVKSDFARPAEKVVWHMVERGPNFNTVWSRRNWKALSFYVTA